MCRSFSWPLLVLVAALPARAADKPKANTLTPKEIADGWILLFDGATTFGWNIDGEAKVEEGALVLGGTRATKAVSTTAFGEKSFAVSVDVRWEGPKPPTFLLFGDRGRLTDATKGRFLTLDFSSSTTAPLRTAPHVCEVPAGSKLFLRSFMYRPDFLEPIFNGKDLAGWKKYEADKARAKSEFRVTRDGWLHMQNGPGDLQTEVLYDDFILRIECKTNGKFLNSGVFFRCIPGQYQNGYEAQIENNFTADPPRQYDVEEHDPKTHERKGTKKVVSAAKDYGTGAIYRRVPARSQAARDNEWFTMTVIAQGRHIATWVNGVQQVNWTDNRPLNDNPRNGCRLEKGAVSLQGHDATTNIDFRNIHIAALPKS
jgi:hypothetical protein